ncbi:hypothetical protein HaLaN_00352 [Haematococcus lacustris]|uniref:Uncharacterized protein n=1 Tax=Haematococcus lacustris TaxID=44745 RepID=A0A699YFT6_HAELA|nr:hypothetical protein HaLaN_00352 [Haematococcus lacustris]
MALAAAAVVVPAPVAGAAEEAVAAATEETVAAAATAAGCAAGATAAGSIMDAAACPVSPTTDCPASTRPGHGGLLAGGFEPGTCHVVAKAHLTDLGIPTIRESPGQAPSAQGQTAAVTQQQGGAAGALQASGCSHPAAPAAPPPPCKASDLATAPADLAAAAQVRQTAQAVDPCGSSEAQAARIPSRMGSSFDGCGPYLAPQDALTALLHAGGFIAEGQEQEELSHSLLSGCMSQQLPTRTQGQGEELRGGEAGAGGTRSSWGGVVGAEGPPWPLFRSSGSNLKVLGGSGTLSVELTPPGWPRGDDSQQAGAAWPGSEDAGHWGPSCTSDLDVVNLDADTDHVLRHKSCSSSELHHHQLPLSGPGPGPAQPLQQALPTHAPLCEAPWQTQPDPGPFPLGLLSTLLSGVGRETLDRLLTTPAPPYPSTMLADRAEDRGLVGMAGVEGPGSHGAADNAQRPLTAAHPAIQPGPATPAAHGSVAAGDCGTTAAPPAVCP